MACITHPPRNPRGDLTCASHPNSSAVYSARKRDGRERRNTISGPEPPEGRVSLRVLGTFLPPLLPHTTSSHGPNHSLIGLFRILKWAARSLSRARERMRVG